MMRFILALLACGLIIGCGGNKRNKEETTQSIPVLPVQEAQAGPETNEKQEPLDGSLFSTKYGREDPFNPAIREFNQSETTEREAGLEGILWDEKQPLALINGVIVKVGTETPQGTVVRIEKEKVVLQDGHREYDLRLKN